MFWSVVINTYERPAALARCLEALARHAAEAAPFEVIVANDGGRADLQPTLRPWRDRLDLRLVDLTHGGRSAARNRGVEAARGERILFLGDDVIVQPVCLAAHRRRAGERLAVTGPYPYAGLRGSPAYRYWAEPNRTAVGDDPEHADWSLFLTGNISLGRADFLAAGGFDERFKLYGWEDIDLGLRLGRAGGRLIYEPAARAVHEHPPLTRAQIWRREFELGYTSWQFWEKWAAIDPVAARETLFWRDPAELRSSPAWRRRLGDRLLAVTDRLAPASQLNARLWERLVYAWRHAGAAAARDGIETSQ